ncbi:MAG: hypothetical protein EOP00_10220 [Pedobacter sp.]|nr:MAG: hypothetical protein EOP00_10220 [Pedobacter sp.]
MKYIFLVCLLFSVALTKAQDRDFEIKVISSKYQTIRGQLKKVSAEGIGMVDFMGNYIIFRPSEIVRIKIRKRGLTIAEGAAGGTLGGLSAGLLILSLDEEDSGNGNDLLKLAGVLTVSGAAVGTLTGAIAQIANTKLTLRINESEEKFKSEYKKLEKYVIPGSIEHVN